MNYQITPIKAFTDNYIWALHNDSHAVIVDPGDAEPVLAFLTEHNLTLSAILITHHHWDHTNGIEALINAYPNIDVFGPNNPQIKGITTHLAENDSFVVANLSVEFSIIETPGHTLDHIVYVAKDFIFCGDTLFSAGCGRMFEGTPELFHQSLSKLSALPAHTKVYCTHEYTQANVNFALSVDKNNENLKNYAIWVAQQRAQSKITLPSSIKREREINPFLRCLDNSIQLNIQTNDNHNTQSTVERFAILRKLKDSY